MSDQTGPKGVSSDDVLEAMRSHITEHGYPPSVRTLCEMVGLSSPSSVHHHLSVLVEAGKIERVPRRPRAIRLKEGL